ncbi:hypothetical protein SPRG_11707 [Saprolegnia parasitica CBS 223.65]|uniref:Cwf15/Cwc15 cell cycle control protein n=1 Tax=Saprolegnia parasitica (strain CBS 223.65) TaxID=695850 RepID=A0A067BVG0_SAPPC|nr:hypothetical protein SPRG_11707 [Saprolegnia parasitica CBS 223.65]KDO22524.1 hypothetical protein SPRG_11707 [Saprolegnia parasitica CBS 223.65]|eukprot:XP_012206771.1 hypothetical protein SPRG_11707 [Saprolegnia parasitica CBS 223.65]
MTTAARPTFNAAMGKKNEGGWNSGGQISMQFSARDLPGHTKLKTRQLGQGTSDELAERDLIGELTDRERKYEEDKLKEVDFAQQKIMRLKDNKTLLLKGDEWEDRAKDVQTKYDDADDDVGDSESDSESDDDDSDDEEAELMRELEKIKREREEERLRKEQAERDEEEKRAKDEVLMGNPLTSAMAPAGSATIKRKWNDDVVFKNQSRNEPELKKRFINDTIRNDFHRRFLKAYIQ